ncbi:DUF2516 family protein [Ornithinimicrobium sp. F0845]|uniref:DUF2516 family protein n=1 Tax=Ornithinimicrobium sp. F0845 TaxID=2926412 RepID=UPI001FF19FC6|nr:DUF2516 family protein [Ornithinimicrobium sp. F0845]MCK0110781.1 DUF2516 family protein [Ornithinimicrobium sp. F0845]
MPTFFDVQQWVGLALGALALGIQVWAFVDALMTRGDAFVAADKRTKGFWLALTGVASAIGFMHLQQPFGLFNLIAIVAAAVYLTDVRPAVAQIRGRGRGGASRGSYGPW